MHAIAKRKPRVYTPRSLALLQALRPLVLSSIGVRQTMRTSEYIPVLDAEVAALGHAFGSSSAKPGRRADANHDASPDLTIEFYCPQPDPAGAMGLSERILSPPQLLPPVIATEFLSPTSREHVVFPLGWSLGLPSPTVSRG